jgi:predicted nucleotidyltransferase
MWPKQFDPETAAREAVEAARRAVGDRLKAAALYGSAAGGEFHPAHSDVNVVFVFSQLMTAELDALKRAHPAWVKRRVVRPLLLSRDSLEQSRDTFPLEYLLIRERHMALHGPDLFAGLEVDRSALRSQVERVLRAQELGLAVSYVALAATPGGARRWAAQAASAIAASASGLLYLRGEEIPATRRALAERCAAAFGVDPSALSALLARGRDVAPPMEAARLLDSAQTLLHRLLQEVERLGGPR